MASSTSTEVLRERLLEEEAAVGRLPPAVITFGQRSEPFFTL